jgi:hypothetical protein
MAAAAQASATEQALSGTGFSSIEQVKSGLGAILKSMFDETKNKMSQIVSDTAGLTELPAQIQDAVSNIINQVSARRWDSSTNALMAGSKLGSMGLDYSTAEVVAGIQEMMKARSWFNDLITQSGYRAEIEGANRGAVGFGGVGDTGSQITNLFNLAYNTTQSSDSVAADIQLLNLLFGGG